MNKQLFIDGFVNRIQEKYHLANTGTAFEILAISAMLDLSFDEVLAEVSTLVNGSGSHDAGIDGIYFDEDNYDCVMHIFQIKSSKHLGDNELSKFVHDYRNLFVFDNGAKLPLNNRLISALNRYKEIVLSGKIVETKLHFVFSGEINDQNRPLVERHLQQHDDLTIVDSNDLYAKIERLLSDKKKRKPISFTFMAEKSNIALKHDPQALISFQIQNIKAVNFRLPALELCKLLDTEKNTNKTTDTLFSENIRGFLHYNKTNKNIKETLESNFSEYFPFMNNGITIIADQVKIPREMQVGFYPIETKNPFIVNGLQTTHVIYDLYQKNPTQLDDVYVLIRLYETTEQDIIEKIIDATNTQSPINFRDKISNKAFNQYTKTFFELHDVGYLLKRGDSFSNQQTLLMKTSVQSETVLKFWYATYNELPEVAKNSKAKVLEDIFDATTENHHPLYSLFNGNKDSAIYQQLFHAYQLYAFVLRQKEGLVLDQQNDFILYSDELIAYSLYKLKLPLEDGYQKSLEAVKKITYLEENRLITNNVYYAHNAYFRSAKSRYDLNNVLNLIEDKPFLVSQG